MFVGTHKNVLPVLPSKDRGSKNKGQAIILRRIDGLDLSPKRNIEKKFAEHLRYTPKPPQKVLTPNVINLSPVKFNPFSTQTSKFNYQQSLKIETFPLQIHPKLQSNDQLTKNMNITSKKDKRFFSPQLKRPQPTQEPIDEISRTTNFIKRSSLSVLNHSEKGKMKEEVSSCESPDQDENISFDEDCKIVENKNEENVEEEGKVLNSSIDQPKKKKVYTALSEMVPLNLEEERKKFFEKNYSYNPQFVYNMQFFKQQFSKPHTRYLKIAKMILNACIKEFGDDEKFLDVTGGRVITQKETEYFFYEYIKQLGLEDHITIVFSENTVSLLESSF